MPDLGAEMTRIYVMAYSLLEMPPGTFKTIDLDSLEGLPPHPMTGEPNWCMLRDVVAGASIPEDWIYVLDELEWKLVVHRRKS